LEPWARGPGRTARRATQTRTSAVGATPKSASRFPGSGTGRRTARTPLTRCQENEHRCRCGFPRCIDSEKVKDGVRDCLDGSDEDKEKGKAYKCPSDSSLQDLMAMERRRRSDSERRRGSRHSGLMTYTVGSDAQATAEETAALIQPTGLMATLTHSEVHGEQTTIYTTDIRRQFVDGTYTQVLSTHSSVLELAPSLNEVEGAFHQRARQRHQTTHGVESFGSLSSGKIFQTAVNELASAVTTGVHATRTHQASLLRSISGDKSTTVLGLNIKSGHVGSLDQHQDSEVPVITVTGTEGLLVQGTGTEQMTYKVFTGTYVNNEGDDWKTYMFFFGNRQLPVEATPSLPDEHRKSEQFDIRSGNQKGVVLDISHKIGVILPSQTVTTIQPTEAPRSESLIFGSGNADDGELMTGMLIEGSEPISIEGMTSTRVATPSTMQVTLDPVPAQSQRDVVRVAKKATPTLYRHGRKFQPTATGRKIAPMDGSTIITDKFFLPQHLGLYTTSPISGASKTADEFFDDADHDYDVPERVSEEPVVMVRMRPPLNHRPLADFRPELLTPSPVKDIRPTKTVGSHHDDYADEVGDVFATDAAYVFNRDGQHHEQSVEKQKTRVTLFGFVDFTTSISGTEVVFQPAATGVSYDFGNTQFPQPQEVYNPFNIPTQKKPDESVLSSKQKDTSYGTATREFVSKMSMLTSTFKGGVEMQSTMFTSTIPMPLKSRAPKYDSYIPDEQQDTISGITPKPVAENEEEVEHDEPSFEFATPSYLFSSPEPSDVASEYMMESVTETVKSSKEELLPVSDSETVMVSMIEGSKTEDFTSSPTEILRPTPKLKRKKTYKTGLVSSITGTVVHGDMTTEWTTLIIGTLIGGRYAHVIQSTSSIFYTQTKTDTLEELTTTEIPTPPPGLILPGDIQIEGLSDQPVTEPNIQPKTNPPAVTAPEPQPETDPPPVTEADFRSKTEPPPVTEGTTEESSEYSQGSLDVYSITSNFAIPLINQSRVIEESYETALSGQDQPSVVALSDGLFLSTLVPTIESSSAPASSTQNVQLLTDGFILPGFQSSDKYEPSSSTSSSDGDGQRIITMGFILPGADPVKQFEDDLVPSDDVKVLTDGFLLPGHDVLPSSEHLVSKSTLQGRIAESVTSPLEQTTTVTSYPITHFSTFTYYTTMHQDGSDIVSSREATTSKVFKNNDQYELARLLGTETASLESSMLPLDPTSTAGVTTLMTAYTYFSTFMSDGSMIISSSQKTLSDILTPTENYDADVPTISPSVVTRPTTLFTTYTYYTTITSDGSTVVSSREEVISNVATPGPKGTTAHQTEETPDLSPVAAPTTYFTTYTYLTTLFKDGTSSVTSNLETVSNVAHGSTKDLNEARNGNPEKLTPTSTTPVTTFYTTYTYLTTLLKDGTSVVSSREEVVSNIMKGTETSPDVSSSLQPRSKPDDREVKPTEPLSLSTYLTTYTYYTTFVRGGTTTIRNRTQVVSKVKTMSAATETELITTPVVSTYYTTYTYFTTVNRGGTKSVKSRESVKTNVVTKYPKTDFSSSTPPLELVTSYTTILSPVTVYRDGTPRVSFISRTSAIVKTPGHTPTTLASTTSAQSIQPTESSKMQMMYTTYTYYTTLYDDDKPVVSSREETVTNIISPTEGAPHGDETPRNEESSTIVRTYYTTYTYFTTFETEGTPTVTSREEVVTNYVTMTPHDIITGVSPTSASQEVQPTSSVSSNETPPLFGSLPSDFDFRKLLHNVPVTHYTTYTYYTTFYKDESTILSSRTEVVSNVVTPTHSSETSTTTGTTTGTTKTPAAPPSSTSTPSTPKFTAKSTKTSRTRSTPSLPNFLRTAALGAPLIVIRNRRDTEDEVEAAEAANIEIYATPVTYYTTYTYFTTYLKPDGNTAVSSSIHVVSSILHPDQRVRPTRTTYHDEIHGTDPVNIYPSHRGAKGCIRCSLDVRAVYVTHTDYITEFERGRPVTSTRYVTLTNYVTVTPGQTVYEHNPQTQLAVPGCRHCKQDPQYTTYTYFTTRLLEGRPVTSTRYETVTNYVTVTVTEQPIHQRIRPTEAHRPIAIYPTTVRDTIYTTYTYFTTSIIRGRPTVSTRYETLTNYVTVTVADRPHEHRVRPTDTYRPVVIRPTAVRDTVYTTYTYFTTRLVRGRPIVSTRYDTVTDYVTVTVTERERIRPTQVHRPIYPTRHGQEPYHTAYTTYTYYTTRYLDGRPVVNTRYETITNVATVTITENATPEFGHQVRPTQSGPYRTYHTTYTYFQTRFIDGTAIVNTRKETITNTVLGALCRSCPAGQQQVLETRPYVEPHRQTVITRTVALSHDIQPTPTTYYTTYTYFTTLLEAGRPVVQTRYETYTDIVSGLVLPTRAIVAPAQPNEDFRQDQVQLTQDIQQVQLPVAQNVSPARRRRWSQEDNGLKESDVVSGGLELNEEAEVTSRFQVSRVQRGLSRDVDVDQARPGRKMLSHGRFPRSPLRDGTPATFAHLRHNANSVKGPRRPPQRFLPKSAASPVFLPDTRVFLLPLQPSLPSQPPQPSPVAFTPSVYYRQAGQNENDYEALRRTAKVEPSFLATPSPQTFYTTFSYFTTVLSDGKPSISTRLETITNVFTNVILPTRAVTVRPHKGTSVPRETQGNFLRDSLEENVAVIHRPQMPPSRKLLSLTDTEKEHSLEDQFIVTDEELASAHRHKFGLVPRSAGSDPNPSPADKTKEYPTGLIQSVEARAIRNGATTVYATEVYGTFINGAYAQVVSTAVRVFSNSPNGLGESAKSSTKQVIIDKSHTPTSAAQQSHNTGLISSFSNTVIHDRTTTAYTTNIYGTYIRGMYAHVAQTTSTVIKPQSTQSSSSITENPQYKTGLLSSLVNTEIHDATTTIWKTQVYGTLINGFYAHVASTVSEVVKPTRTTFVQSSSTHSPVYVAPSRSESTGQSSKSKSYTTGLLTARTNTIVNGGLSTEVVTNIYGTFVGDLYAQVARTTTRTLSNETPSSSTTSSTSVSSTPAKLLGIISSTVQSVTNGNVVTYYTTELHGTNVGNLYAQIARTSTRTETLRVHSTKSPAREFLQKTGLLSTSLLSSEVHGDTTTLHVSEVYGTYIGEAYAQFGRSTRKTIAPSTTTENPQQPDSQKTGLVTSTISTDVHNGVTTLYTTEIHGTYINGFYAHIARRSSQILQPSSHQTTASVVAANSETLLSSDINTEVRNGATTLHTTNVYGTYINGYYAHVARSTSRVLEQKIASTSTADALKTGLVSHSVRTTVGNGLVTEYSIDVYGTFINGFYAHIARTTTNVSPQSPAKKTDSTVLISSTPVLPPPQAAKSSSDVRIFTTPTFSLVDSTASTMLSVFTTISTPTEQSTVPTYSRVSPATALQFETISESSFTSSKQKIYFVELDTTTENILDEIGLTTTLSVEQSLNDKSVIPSFEEITLFSSMSSETAKESAAVIPTPVITIEIKEENTHKPETTFLSSITVDSTQTNEIFEKESAELREPSTVRFRPVFPTRRPHAPNRSTLVASSDLQDEDGDDYGGNEFLDEEDEDYNEYDEKSVQAEEPKPRPTKRHRPTRAGYTRGPRQPQTTHQIKHQTEDDEYDIYHEDDYEHASRDKSQASRADDARPHSPAAGINIRPFRRDRGAFGIPSRTANKPSFTLQLRRPQARQRTNGRRPAKEEKHDDDDIEAEEAIHSSAATPQLHLGRRRGSARPVPGKVGGRPTPFARTRPSNDKTHGIAPNRAKSEDEYSDYDQEEEDYTTERTHPGRGRLNIKPTARLPTNGRTRGLGGRPSTRIGPTHQEDDDSNEETHTNGRLRGRLNPLAKGRRNRNRGRAPNLKSSFNAVGKDVEESPNLPFARLRGNRRRSSYNPRARRTSLTSRGHGSTKPAVTVTSVITTVKTLPIYHGFKTSYATLTTTAFASSVILPTAYSTTVGDDGNTKTFLSSKTDTNGLFKTVTEVLITTTDFQQFRILPIKVGFSTRTDTITETTVLTQLTTVFSTITPDVIPTTPATAPPAYPVPFYPQIPNQEFSILTSSYVTTETIVTSTVLPIVLRGRTLLSTIKTTKFSESTITKTASVPVPQVPTAAPYIPQPYFAVPQLTTLLTLYVTGDQGDVTPLVTTVTVPFYQQPQPFFHTKVARSVPDRASQFATLASTAFLGFPIDGSRLDALGRDERPEEVRLFSSGVESSVENSPPSTESTSTLNNAASEAASDVDAVTTISMGPLTEVYEQPATEVPTLPKTSKGTSKKWKSHRVASSFESRTDNKYGIGAKFVSRKLQQFEEERDEEVRPVRDFTRIRGRVRATPVEALALPTPEALVDNSGVSSPDFEFSDGGHHNDALDGARHGARRGRILRRPVQRNRAIIDGSRPSFNGFRGPHGGFIRRRPPHVVEDHLDLSPPPERNGGLHLGEEPQAFSSGKLHEPSVVYLSSYNLDPSPSVSLDNLISSFFVGDGHSLSSVPVGETSLSDPVTTELTHQISADAVTLSGLETSKLPKGKVRRIKVLRPAPHGEGSLGDGSKKVRRVTVTRTFSLAGEPTRYEDYRPQAEAPFSQDYGSYNQFAPHQNVVPVLQQPQQEILRVPQQVSQQSDVHQGSNYDPYAQGLNQQSYQGYSPNVPFQFSQPVNQPTLYGQPVQFSPHLSNQQDQFTPIQPVQNFVPTANNLSPAAPSKEEARPEEPPQSPAPPARGSRRTIFRRVRPTNSKNIGERRTSLVRKTRPITSTPVLQLTSVSIEPTHVFVSAASGEFNRLLGPAKASQEFLAPVSKVPDPPAPEAADYEPDAPHEEKDAKRLPSTDDVTPNPHQFKRIIRVKKPGEGKSGQRRKVVLNRRPSVNSLQARGPVTNGNEDLVAQNIDVVSHNKEAAVSSHQLLESVNPSLSFEIGATVPLTYYTTFTYLTTFLHGTDTVYNSREAVLSSVVTETLNSNIVNVIQNHGGFTTALDGVSMVHLGSRTKGAATTIVNLESRLQIFNSDIYKGIHPTPTAAPDITFPTASSSVLEAEALQSPYQKAPEFNSGTVQLTDLVRLPKTLYTLYTYYYTLFDGLETKSSVRSEISSSVVPGENEFLPPIKHTRIRNGLLPLGLDVTTVHLGSRDIDGTTTEVNIGMRTVIKFDGVRDAVIAEYHEPIVPTASLFPSHPTEAVDNKIEFISNQERSSLLEDALQPSYSIAHDDPQQTINVHATPVILFPVEETTETPRAKVRIITSRVNKPLGGLKSGVFQAGPGVRVRIKPIIRQPEEDTFTTSKDETTHGYDLDTTEGLTSPSPIAEVTEEEPLLSSVFEAPTTPEDEEHHKGRKRLKVTLRRPTPGDKLARTNSLNTRFVRPSRFEITTKPRFYVVTRTNAAGVARPTKNPFTVKVSKRLKPTDLIRATPSVSIIYETFTTTTSVPVIFGLQTSYREVVITASTPLTVTISPTFGGRSPDLIEPSETVMLTYFTTTTYTVPYTLGDQTLFTTVRETNSRIVTETVAASHVVEDVPASRYPDDYLDYSAQLIGRGAAPKHQSSLELFASHYQHRPGLSTRISDGVTLIVASGGDYVATTQLFSHQPTPYTLQPTLLLDAVLMKEHFDGQNVSPQPYSVSYSTKTLFTTYTYFTTFFTDDSSSISSSEQVISNTVTIPVTHNIQPTATPHVPELRQAQTYLETSERVVTSTSYNTFTFYATLFNGSSSVVTPFEEVQSQVFTITESFTITRTIMPSSVHLLSSPTLVHPQHQYQEEQERIKQQHQLQQQQQQLQQLQSHQLQPSATTMLSTLYSTQTNFITFFQGTSTIVTSIEEILSDVVTLTVPHGLATPVISHSYLLSPTVKTPEFSTRTYLTTQTQYVTFFRGKETILSSIEEIGTTVVTERVGSRPSVYSRPYGTPIASSIAPTRTSTPTFVLPSYSATPADLVPSIRTYYTTYTYFTTFFTDSSSIVASRENVVTSHVTLFVPRASLTSSTKLPPPSRIQTTSTSTSSSSIAPTTTKSSTPTYYRPTMTTPPYDTKLYTTGTTYTTYTFYTTLFGGQDKIVISSEQVVPQIVTTRIGSKPSTTSTRARVTPTVLTHFTTYTYFTTLVKESETIVSSSEEVITQLVSTTITPSSTTSFVPEVNIVTSSLHKPPKKETAAKVASKVEPTTAKKPEKVSSFKLSSDVTPKSSISSFSSVTLFGSTELKSSYSVPSSSLRPTSSTPSFTTLHSVFVEEESTKPLLGVSTTVIDGSTVIFFTDIPGGQDDDEEVDTFSSSSLLSLYTSSEMLSPVFVPPASATVSSFPESSFDTLLLSSAPVTSTTVLDSSTRYIGQDNETTTLSPNVTLFVVTGTDGILTRLTEATFTSRTSDISPSKAAKPAAADIIPTEIPTVQHAPLPSAGDGDAGGGLGIGFPSKPIKPGSIIDLADVLGGNANLGGNIGEAIKGIVHLLSNGKRNETDESGDLHPSQVKEDVPLPPTDGVAVSNAEEPVYIPVGAIASDSSGRDKATRVGSTQARHPEKDGVDSETLFTFMHSSEFPVYSDDVHTDIITGVETIFLGPTESHYDDDSPDVEDSMPERADKDAVHLVGSVQKNPSSYSSSDSPTPALDSSTEVITGDKTIFFGDFDKFSELTQRAEDHKGDITISDPKELSKFVGVQTIFFPDAPLQSSLPSEVQITGATTIFGDSFTPILPGVEQQSSVDASNTPAIAPDAAKSVSGATTIFFQLDGDRAPILPSVSTSVSTVTQYVTSVESVTRTLTLTTTKVYYTRDSPLTITSVFTTTIAPRTFVSTIIGSRTILGTLPEATESVEGKMTTPLPIEATTTVTTTTLIFNSITTTVVRTLVIPTERPDPTRSSSFDYPATTSVHVVTSSPEVKARTPESADSKAPTLRPPHRRPTTPRPQHPTLGKRPVIAFRAPSRTPDTASTKPMPSGPKFKIPFPKPPTTTTTTQKPTRAPPVKAKPGRVTPVDGYPPVCLPGCNAKNKEVCRELQDGSWACHCKPGYGRQEGNNTCTGKSSCVLFL
ncbi:unnamed protein product, partial [Ixodes hexagonus]